LFPIESIVIGYAFLAVDVGCWAEPAGSGREAVPPHRASSEMRLSARAGAIRPISE
jgi:hypothetical protein